MYIYVYIYMYICEEGERGWLWHNIPSPPMLSPDVNPLRYFFLQPHTYTLPIVGYFLFCFFFLRAKKKKVQQKQIALGKHSYYFHFEPIEFVGSCWFFFFLPIPHSLVFERILRSKYIEISTKTTFSLKMWLNTQFLKIFVVKMWSNTHILITFARIKAAKNNVFKFEKFALKTWSNVHILRVPHSRCVIIFTFG